MRPLSWVSIFLLLLIFGCGGGKTPTVNDPPGPDPDPPSDPAAQAPNKPNGPIDKPAIFPRGDIGRPGHVVEILAKQVSVETEAPRAPEDEIVGFSWNFTNAEPSTSRVPRPKITLKNEGQVGGSLTVETASGQKESYPLWFNVTMIDLTPTIYGLAPESPSGGVGDTITFEALATYLPDTWSWDFGPAAEPSTSTDASPTITLLTPGKYTGTVTCSNVVGTSAPIHFDYTVLPSSSSIPRITDLVLTGGSGHAEQWGTYHAITNQSLASYTWDFGGGATPRTAAYSVVPVAFADVGSYHARVIGHTTEGFNTPPFEFTINVGTYRPNVRKVMLNPPQPIMGEPFDIHVDSTGSPTRYEIVFSHGGVTGAEVVPGPDVEEEHPVYAEGPDPDFTVTATRSGWLNMEVRAYRFSDASVSWRKQVRVDVRGIPVNQVAPDMGIRGSIGQQVAWAAPHYADAAFWNFGFGTNPNSSSDPGPTTLLQLPGAYTGTLTAFNELGSMEPAPFQYRVGHQWSQPNPALTDVELVLDAELIGDRFRVLTWDYGVGYGYAEALQSNPSGDGDWIAYPLSVDGESFNATRMLQFQGKPLLITEERAGSSIRLVAHIPTSASPTSSAEWQRRVMSGIPFGARVKDVASDSAQVVAVMGMLTIPGLCFARSLDTSLLNWQWSSINTDYPVDAAVTLESGRILVAGHQAGEGLSQLRFYEATTTTPIQASNWNGHVVATVQGGEGFRSLATYEARPLVISHNQDRALGIWVANSASPQSVNDWSQLPTSGVPGLQNGALATHVAVSGSTLILSPVGVYATVDGGNTGIQMGLLVIEGDLMVSSNYRPELPGFGTSRWTHSASFDSAGQLVSVIHRQDQGLLVAREI